MKLKQKHNIATPETAFVNHYFLLNLNILEVKNWALDILSVTSNEFCATVFRLTTIRHTM